MTGMKMFALEQPIALQLAWIGSQSMINYSTNTTIRFGCETYEEYFDITNIEYYDTILGTLFLRKLGVILDFSSPGVVLIGDENIPIGKVSFDNSTAVLVFQWDCMPPWTGDIRHMPRFEALCPALFHRIRRAT
jgi:hypothetical protein